MAGMTASSSMMHSIPSSSIMTSMSGLDEASVTSHSSSIRNTGQMMTPTSSGSGRTQNQVLAKADALARADNDPARALDEVLAERNRFSVEVGKLSTENSRLWNLLKKIRKENDELKANKSSLSSSPLAPSSMGKGNATSRTSSSAAQDSKRNVEVSRRQGGPGTSLGSVAQEMQESNDTPREIARDGIPAASQRRELSGNVDDPVTAKSYSTNDAGVSSSSTSAMQSSTTSLPLNDDTKSNEDGAYVKHVNGQQPKASPSRKSHESSAAPPSRSDYTANVISNDSIPSVNSEARPSTSSSTGHVKPILEQRAAAISQQQQAQSVDDHGTRSQEYDPMSAQPSISASLRAASHRKTSSVDAALVSQSAQPNTLISPPPRRGSSRVALTPRLEPSMLSQTTVKVAGTNLRPSEQGMEVVAFFIHVSVATTSAVGVAQTSAWRIERTLVDLVNLDLRIRSKNGEVAYTILADTPLPDRSLFADHLPGKVDRRNAMVQKYLATVVQAALPIKEDLCVFLSVNASRVPRLTVDSVRKEGVLIKKSQIQDRWIARWYVLNGDFLESYEWRNGPKISAIQIWGAQIGRQQRSTSSETDDQSYRHAFLILESRPSANINQKRQISRHVLCAESDEDRDEWVDVLVRAIDRQADEVQAATSLPSEFKSPKNRSNGIAEPAPYAAEGVTSHWQKASEDAAQATGVISGSRESRAETAASSAPQMTAVHAPPYSPKQRAQMSNTHARASPQTDGASVNASSASATSSRAPGVRGEGTGSIRSDAASLAMSPRLGQMQLGESADQQRTHISASSEGQSLIFDSPQSQRIAQGIIKQRATSHSIPRNSSISSLHSSRPSQDAPMVPQGSQEGASAKERLRPSISGPMNGTPIPAGYKFGARDEASSNLNVSNSGGVSNSVAGHSKGDPAAASGSEGKKRFWQRFGGNSEKQSGKSKRVFGVPLAEAVAVCNVAEGLDLPSVVYRCIEYLEQRDAASEEGIYRLSGSSAVIKALTERFNTHGDVDLLAPTEPFYDPHAIAGLLKQYLRELPTSVLTRELHLDFMRANDIVDRRERVNELGNLVSMLPQPNYALLRTLCSHLNKVIKQSEVNKMNMRNVGIVFSPTLGIPAGVFALFLTEFDWVFYTDAKGDPAPRFIEEDILPPDEDELGVALQNQIRTPRMPMSPPPTGGAPPSPLPGNGRSKRNSLLYNEAEAERLLGGPQTRSRLAPQSERMEGPDQPFFLQSPFVTANADGTARFDSPVLEYSPAQSQDSPFPASNAARAAAARNFGANARSFTDPVNLSQPMNPSTPVMGGVATPRMPNSANGSDAASPFYAPSRSYDSQPPSSPAKYAMTSPPRRRPMQSELGNILDANPGSLA